jgi:hypothetical protein
MDNRKRNEEMKGMSPDELIEARTGYAGVDDVRKSVLNEQLTNITHK